MTYTNPAITYHTFVKNSSEWLRVVRFNESGLVINFVGDHFYTIPQVFNDKKLLRSVLGQYYKKHILVYIEINSASKINDFKNELLNVCKHREIFIKIDSNYKLEEVIDQLIIKGYEIAFFISRPEKFFLTQNEILTKLEIIARNHRVSFIYFSELNLSNPKFSEQQRKYTSMFQNIIYQQIYDKKDADFFIDYNEKLWHLTIPSAFREKILEECGGDLWFIRHVMRAYRNNPTKDYESYFTHTDLLKKVQVSWNQLFNDEQETLKDMAFYNKAHAKNKIAFDYLQKIGLLINRFNTYTLSIHILKRITQLKEINHELHVRNEIIYLGEKNFSQTLTEQENILLKFLLTQKNILITREQIAHVLWNTEENYSDWALDKIISRLRKILITHGMPKNSIRTKKEHGYVFNA